MLDLSIWEGKKSVSSVRLSRLVEAVIGMAAIVPVINSITNSRQMQDGWDCPVEKGDYSMRKECLEREVG